MARTWPAEASTGTVFLQLRDPAYQDRVGMWSLFGTLVHEFLHIVTHPNYGNAADAIGGGARDILIEGMDDHMRAQVWPAVRARAASDVALRTTVEGPFFSATADPADYAPGGDDRHRDPRPPLRLDGRRRRDRRQGRRGQRAGGVLHGPRRGARDRRGQRERAPADRPRVVDAGRRRRARHLRRAAGGRDGPAGPRPHRRRPRSPTPAASRRPILPTASPAARSLTIPRPALAHRRSTATRAARSPPSTASPRRSSSTPTASRRRRRTTAWPRARC